jgi:preprotein translocase SecE subunit
VAKTRAQRKAERRAREAREARAKKAGALQESDVESDVEAQHDTQMPKSGDQVETEAVIQTGAEVEEYGEEVLDEPGPPAPPKPPAPSRADVGAPAEPKESRRERKRRERAEQRAKEERRRSREKQPAETQERRRGPVIGFLASCWAELKRVQWPTRETLVQASGITIVFIAVAAAYLGALDAAFNWLIQRIL